MELFSMRFKELVSKILNSEKTLLCTIKENGDVFTEDIKKRKDVTLVTVNYENRETLPEKVFEMLRTTKN
jgi:nucleoside-triphosphatase